MTRNLQKQREQEIIEVVKRWAYDEGDSYLISFWELASNLNNRWAAHLFVSEKFKEEDISMNGYWAVASYHHREFRRMINWTVRRMKGAKIVNQKHYNQFYRIKKSVVI